jgi:hypothetical protein
MVYNGTGATEIVAPRQTFDQVMSGASGGSRPTAGSTAPVHITLQLERQAVTDLLDGRIVRRENTLARDARSSY